MASPVEQLENDLISCLMIGSVPIIWGPPGVGKTALVNAIGSRLKMKVFTIIGSLCDPTDINGFPVVDDEVTDDAEGRKHKVIRFAPRDVLLEIVQKHEGRALMFMDELTCTPPAVLSAILTTVMTKRFGDFQLDPFKVGMICAANDPQHAANGQELPPPMVNRLAHFDFPCDHSAAIEWSGRFTGYWGNPPRIGFDDEFVTDDAATWARSCVAAYIRRFPGMWHVMPTDAGGMAGWPSPRSWDRVSRQLALTKHLGRSPMTAITAFTAEVGSEAAIQFSSFLKELNIPDPEDVITNYQKYVPSGRIDVDFATMLGVSAAVVARATPDRVIAGWTIANKMATSIGKDNDNPTYEAACVACIELSQLQKEKRYRDLAEQWWPRNVRDDENAKFTRKLAELMKPFRKLKHLLSDLNEKSGG